MACCISRVTLRYSAAKYPIRDLLPAAESMVLLSRWMTWSIFFEGLWHQLLEPVPQLEFHHARAYQHASDAPELRGADCLASGEERRVIQEVRNLDSE